MTDATAPDQPLTEADRLLSADELADAETLLNGAKTIGNESRWVGLYARRLLSHIRAQSAENERLRDQVQSAVEAAQPVWSGEVQRFREALEQIAKSDGPITGTMIGPLYMAGLHSGLAHNADRARAVAVRAHAVGGVDAVGGRADDVQGFADHQNLGQLHDRLGRNRSGFRAGGGSKGLGACRPIASSRILWREIGAVGKFGKEAYLCRPILFTVDGK